MSNSRVPLEIKTCESATDHQLADNILKNVELVKEWVHDSYKIHSGHALMISAGKSFTEFPQAALKDFFDGYIPGTHGVKTFCVKHALPHFQATGFRPDYCVALDPRPIDGVSTLGKKRSSLYTIYPETTYLIASMTHPSVTEYLIANGAKVVGWHSMCAGTDDERVQQLGIRNWIVGGSCSAMRGINLARVFGFREISLLGYDSSFSTADGVYHLTKKNADDLKEALAILDKYDVPVDFNKLIDRKKKEIEPPPEHIGMINFLTHRNYEVTLPPAKGSDMLLPVIVNGFKSLISPELAAQVKDLEVVFANNQDVVFHNLSGGFCKALFDGLGGDDVINPVDYIEMEPGAHS